MGRIAGNRATCNLRLNCKSRNDSNNEYKGKVHADFFSRVLKIEKYKDTCVCEEVDCCGEEKNA